MKRTWALSLSLLISPPLESHFLSAARGPCGGGELRQRQ